MLLVLITLTLLLPDKQRCDVPPLPDEDAIAAASPTGADSSHLNKPNFQALGSSIWVQDLAEALESGDASANLEPTEYQPQSLSLKTPESQK